MVYHIETQAHDVILANGASSETFIDAAGRTAFDNYQEYRDLYGAERIIPELKMPRIASQHLLPASIREKMAQTHKDLDQHSTRNWRPVDQNKTLVWRENHIASGQ